MITAENSNVLSKVKLRHDQLSDISHELSKFIPNAALSYIQHNKDKFASQLRHVVVLFASLGIDLKRIDRETLNRYFMNIQKITYKY